MTSSTNHQPEAHEVLTNQKPASVCGCHLVMFLFDARFALFVVGFALNLFLLFDENEVLNAYQLSFFPCILLSCAVDEIFNQNNGFVVAVYH